MSRNKTPDLRWHRIEDAYMAALRFMQEKGVLEEFIDREIEDCLGTHTITDIQIIHDEEAN